MIKNIMIKLAKNDKLGNLVYIWDTKKANKLLAKVAKATGMTITDVKASRSYKNFILALNCYVDGLDY